MAAGTSNQIHTRPLFLTAKFPRELDYVPLICREPQLRSRASPWDAMIGATGRPEKGKFIKDCLRAAKAVKQNLPAAESPNQQRPAQNGPVGCARMPDYGNSAVAHIAVNAF
jgi:hypothetical protein